jgi:hypothetical protein
VIIVHKIFGQKDMDKGHSSPFLGKGSRVEKKLGQLAPAAGRISIKIKAAYCSSQADVKLSKSGHATLMNFVFIMKYRSMFFFNHYNHQRHEDY